MSLKSFDKFCENMITGKKQEKAIFDERQNQMQTKIVVETLSYYIAAIIINTIVMEYFYQWCESYLVSMVLFCMAAYLYYTVRSAAKGCLVGVNGSYPIKVSAGITLLMGIVWGINFSLGVLTGKESIILDGRLQNAFIASICAVLIIINGIITIVFAKKYDRKIKEQTEANDEN